MGPRESQNVVQSKVQCVQIYIIILLVYIGVLNRQLLCCIQEAVRCDKFGSTLKVILGIGNGKILI